MAVLQSKWKNIVWKSNNTHDLTLWWRLAQFWWHFRAMDFFRTFLAWFHLNWDIFLEKSKILTVGHCFRSGGGGHCCGGGHGCGCGQNTGGGHGMGGGQKIGWFVEAIAWKLVIFSLKSKFTHCWAGWRWRTWLALHCGLCWVVLRKISLKMEKYFKIQKLNLLQMDKKRDGPCPASTSLSYRCRGGESPRSGNKSPIGSAQKNCQ